MSDYDPILAAIQATKYADAVMARTAGEMSPEDAVNLPDPNKAVRIPLDDPHTDWRPRWGDKSTTEKWHPPYGETHVKYHVYQVGGGRNPTLWRANHHGTYEGMQTLSPPNGSGEDLTFPNYTMSADPEPVGERRNFRNPKDAKAAAEKHYRENYGTPPKHDYDIEKIMDDNPQAPAGGKRGLGDDEDYSRIFDAVRRALKKAGMALRRKATGGDMQSYWDWYSDQHYQGVHPDSLYDFAHWYTKHIDPSADKQHVYDFAKNDAFAKGVPQQFVKYDGTPVTDHSYWNHDFHNPDPYVEYGEWHDQVGSPDNQKSRGGIGVLGPDGFDNPWEGGNGRYTPLPISQPKGHNGEGFDPDDKQDPFDPRLIGAGLHARHAARARAVSEAVQRRIAAELSPPCPDCGQVAGFDEHMVSPRVKVCRNCDYPMTDIGHDGLLENILRGHDQSIADLPGTDHPTLGKHGNNTH